MEHTDVPISVLTERLVQHESRLRELEERDHTQQLVIAWLLAQVPNHGGLRFLSRQANELDGPELRQKFRDSIDLLDELRELVLQLPDAPA